MVHLHRWPKPEPNTYSSRSPRHCGLHCTLVIYTICSQYLHPTPHPNPTHSTYSLRTPPNTSTSLITPHSHYPHFNSFHCPLPLPLATPTNPTLTHFIPTLPYSTALIPLPTTTPLATPTNPIPKTPPTLAGEFKAFGFTARDMYHDLDAVEATRWLYFEKFKMMLHYEAVSLPW